MEMVTVEYTNRLVCAAFITGMAFAFIAILVAMAIHEIVRRIANRKSKANFIYINGKVYTNDGQDG